MNPTDHGSDFGVEWVDVTIEPHHVEQLANQAVRIYEATITPGTATQFHRHTHDTIYVITAGGRFRSDEPGHQITGTRVGRSTPLPRQRRRNGIDVPAPIGATTRARLSRIARIAIRIDAAYSFADVLPHQRGKGSGMAKPTDITDATGPAPPAGGQGPCSGRRPRGSPGSLHRRQVAPEDVFQTCGIRPHIRALIRTS